MRHDVGGWISGPSANAEQIEAERVLRADVLLLDDGTSAEATDLRRGDFWMNTGRHAAWFAIGWRSLTGSASGVLFRASSDVPKRTVSEQRP